MNTVFILAGGRQERWNGSDLKQLSVVYGMPVIERTMEQLAALGHDCKIVSDHLGLMVKFQSKVYAPAAHRFAVETLKSTSHLWRGQVRVLLGDVVYTRDALEQILNYHGSLHCFGSQTEMFGLSFNDHSNILNAIRYAIWHAEQGGHGKLWNLYRAYHLLDLNYHVIEKDFTFIDDLTTDFDTVEEFEQVRDRFESLT